MKERFVNEDRPVLCGSGTPERVFDRREAGPDFVAQRFSFGLNLISARPDLWEPLIAFLQNIDN
jgi:hypothetical protein